MTGFKDRERAEEKKFQLNQEQEFKSIARRNRLFGQWLAQTLQLNPTASQTIISRIVESDFERAGTDDVLAAAQTILQEHNNTEITERQLQLQFEQLLQQARFEIAQESN